MKLTWSARVNPTRTFATRKNNDHYNDIAKNVAHLRKAAPLLKEYPEFAALLGHLLKLPKEPNAINDIKRLYNNGVIDLAIDFKYTRQQERSPHCEDITISIKTLFTLKSLIEKLINDKRQSFNRKTSTKLVDNSIQTKLNRRNFSAAKQSPYYYKQLADLAFTISNDPNIEVYSENYSKLGELFKALRRLPYLQNEQEEGKLIHTIREAYSDCHSLFDTLISLKQAKWKTKATSDELDSFHDNSTREVSIAQIRELKKTLTQLFDDTKALFKTTQKEVQKLKNQPVVLINNSGPLESDVTHPAIEKALTEVNAIRNYFNEDFLKQAIELFDKYQNTDKGKVLFGITKTLLSFDNYKNPSITYSDRLTLQKFLSDPKHIEKAHRELHNYITIGFSEITAGKTPKHHEEIKHYEELKVLAIFKDSVIAYHQEKVRLDLNK